MGVKKNNAESTLAGDLQASGMALVLKTGEGALFPTTAEAPYPLKIEKYEGTVCVKREVLTISARSGDALTISARASQSCVQDDSADPKTRTANALSFNSGDSVKLTLTEDDWNNLEEEIYTNIPADLDLKLDITTFNQEKEAFGASNTGNDDYEVTISGIASYINGQTFKIQADVTNIGSATLDINGLGVKQLKKAEAGVFVDLSSDDIIADGIFFVTYNETLDIFQFSVDPASAVIINVENTNTSLFVNDSGSAGSALSFFQETNDVPTLFNPIGQVLGNSRIAIKVLGSGVADNKINLYLSKIGTPTQNLNVRIETDNSGLPSGTLVDINATGTISQAGLTTSLVNTQINLGGSVTLDTQAYWIIIFQGTYGSETIDYLNYYNIGYITTGSLKKFYAFDGTSYIGTTGTLISDSHGFNMTSSGSVSASGGFQFTTNKNLYLTSVSKSGSSTATRCLLLNSAGTIIATATFVGGVATFRNVFLTTGTTYRIVADNNGATYTMPSTYTTTYPQNKTNINYTGGYFAGGASSIACNITTISTTEIGSNIFEDNFYLVANFLLKSYLTKANATDTTKIKFNGFASENFSFSNIKVNTSGVDSNQSGLTNGEKYYLSNTNGLISTTPGTNNVLVGRAISDTKIIINAGGL